MADGSISTDDKVARIEIPPITEQRMSLLIEGETPLLQHAWSPWNRAEMLAKQLGKTFERRKRNPENDVYLAIEADREYHPALRCDQFKSACVGACRYLQGVAMTQAKGALFVPGDHLPLYGLFEPREDMVRLSGRRGVADIRFRPEWTEWYAEVEIILPGGVLTPEAALNLVTAGGMFSGLGDKRPSQNGGTNGRFRVVADDDRVRVQKRIKQLKPKMLELSKLLKKHHQAAHKEIHKRLGFSVDEVKGVR